MIFIGIDPGLSGAVAIVDENGQPFDELWFIKGSETPHDIAEFIQMWSTVSDGVQAVIENVNAMPSLSKGSQSNFKLGQSKGFYIGMLVAMRIRFNLATPAVWQKRMKCLWPKGKKKPTDTQKKNLNKSTAQRMWPDQKITHANADALLLAEYCRLIKE